MDEKISQDYQHIKNIADKSDSTFAPFFYAGIALGIASVLNGAWLTVASFIIPACLLSLIGIAVFRSVSAQTKLLISATEGLAGILTASVIEYGLNANAPVVYAYCGGIATYILSMRLLSHPLGKIYFHQKPAKEEFSMANPKDPRITTTKGHPSADAEAGPAPGPIDPDTGQHESYWVLTEEERAKGFVAPVRRTYVHGKCGSVTTMSVSIAETYARDPGFYGSTFCCACRAHFPVKEFKWDGTNEVVGSCKQKEE